MTTDSAHAPRAGGGGPATAVQRPVPAIHPPRSADGPRPGPARQVRLRRGRAAAPLVAGDTLALAATSALVPGLRLAPLVLVPLLVLHLSLHVRGGLYRRRLSPSALLELPALLGHALVLWCAAAACLAAVGPWRVLDWTVLATAVAAQTLIGCTVRGAVHQLLRLSAARHCRSTLIVGGGSTAQQISAALYAHPAYGMRPVGLVETGAGGTAEAAGPGAVDGNPALPVLAAHEDIRRAVIQTTVRHALFVGHGRAGADDPSLVQLLGGHGVHMWLVDTAGTEHRRVSADHLWGFAVRPLAASGHRASRRGKRVLDTSLACLALLAAAPVMGLCALAVRISDGPGVLFRQERIGMDGRAFTLLKFRTLRPADDHESATRWSVAMDRRMSGVGSLLRRTSLDELPQLWNVVRGDMSLVGPRPERPYFVTKFSGSHPGYRSRHRMPVGITGLAQISGLRGDTSIEDRARFDNHYIDSWSLWQDICILVRTAGSLFRMGGS
ncbi:exopolysaccharide biosynthesis polyprenyl glycosylphosphotransferase [Streptomyces sp. NBC_00859]|uniref:exopolysaccharide biosynthesis polyprenyl glycosylphosphotransferase n=1 Tax=Streptomyces sp. NBC_00859 TaxID=2903682 RepID=UPI003867A8B4|nr:exopolysaccharide biosynthesis polyprenyl glycosylphosphotransferase [Streptomyces sp. NBC_00859]